MQISTKNGEHQNQDGGLGGGEGERQERAWVKGADDGRKRMKEKSDKRF